MTALQGMDAMMKFRTLYLKAIAESWLDEKCLEDLKNDPIKTLYGDENSFPWDILIEIESVTAQESLWDPTTAGGWVGRNAVISLWIPPPPKEEDDYARAWAAYYDEFPSFLGSAPAANPERHRARTPKLGQSYPVGMGHWNEFLEFGGVFMRLVALAWSNEQVQRELRDPKVGPIKKGTSHSKGDAPRGVDILNKWLGYQMPWNMNVAFKLSGWSDGDHLEEKHCRWHPEKREWGKPSNGSRPDSCRNALHFYIPRKPSTERSLHAIALSAYNVTGDQYPFTCP